MTVEFESITGAVTDEPPTCPYCNDNRYPGCDGRGWLAALGPFRDGSYSTTRPCPNDNPFAAD